MKNSKITGTKENIAKVSALKKISETKWVGNTIHNDIDKCLTAINLNSNNSGWYKPTAIKINGLIGFYMVNEDGSVFCESRIIKDDDLNYRIEHLTAIGWNEFEANYNSFL